MNKVNTRVPHIACNILHTEVRVKEKRAFTVVHLLSAVIVWPCLEQNIV